MILSFHAWPLVSQHGGQQVSRTHTGVLCLDEETGVACYVHSERSQRSNQKLAEDRVREILEKVITW